MSITTRRRAAGPVSNRWRTVDIVVASVIAAAFGVVYWGWGNIWAGSHLFDAVPPVLGVVNALWVMAGPLGALVVRKPGAAVYTELVAAIFEALVSAQWSGSSIVVYGLVQGLGAELVFLALRYRVWNLPAALAAGALAGVAEGVLDLWIYSYYPQFSTGQKLSYWAATTAGGLLIAGLGSWLLVRALAATGVLSPFASGREQKLV
jgi:energy-coupling factor transport system substrate-specific component